MTGTGVVTDTNVLLTANGNNEKAALSCVRICVLTLLQIQSGSMGFVVVDNGFRIVSEYNNKLTPYTGQLPGDVFLTWLLTNLYDPTVCERVEIVQNHQSNDPNDFIEFPADPALAKFDASDRKFIAVALTSQYKPDILNATDSDWRNFLEALQANGITVRFLCPESMPT